MRLFTNIRIYSPNLHILLTKTTFCLYNSENAQKIMASMGKLHWVCVMYNVMEVTEYGTSTQKRGVELQFRLPDGCNRFCGRSRKLMGFPVQNGNERWFCVLPDLHSFSCNCGYRHLPDGTFAGSQDRKGCRGSLRIHLKKIQLRGLVCLDFPALDFRFLLHAGWLLPEVCDRQSG